MKLAHLRKLFEVERLPPPPAQAPQPRRRSGWARLLLAPEPLPQGEEARQPAHASPGFLRQLVAIEPLPPPLPPQERPPRTRWARLLLAPEPLPREEPPPGSQRRRGRWLEWLLKPEEIEPRKLDSK